MISKMVVFWMKDNAHEYCTSTELAEAAADEFDLYEDDIDYVIPEVVFEAALEVLPSWRYPLPDFDQRW